MNRSSIVWVLSVWVVLCLCPATSSADPALEARLSYRKSYLLFKKKQWKSAQKSFRETLKLLQKRHSVLKARKQQFNTLGISDIYYHLAVISFRLNQAKQACLSLQKLQTQIKSLPDDPKTGWRTWAINPLLPERFQDGNNRFQQRCVMLPAQLSIQGLPSQATIELQNPAVAGKPASWKLVTQPVPLVGTSQQLKARLRLSAPGFVTQEIAVSIERWGKKTIKVSMKKKPKPRVVTRRLPPRQPPPPPPKTSPWVWVGVGLGTAAVAAGVIVTTVILTQPRRPTEVKGQLDPNTW